MTTTRRMFWAIGYPDPEKGGETTVGYTNLESFVHRVHELRRVIPGGDAWFVNTDLREGDLRNIAQDDQGLFWWAEDDWITKGVFFEMRYWERERGKHEKPPYVRDGRIQWPDNVQNAHALNVGPQPAGVQATGVQATGAQPAQPVQPPGGGNQEDDVDEESLEPERWEGSVASESRTSGSD